MPDTATSASWEVWLTLSWGIRLLSFGVSLLMLGGATLDGSNDVQP